MESTDNHLSRPNAMLGTSKSSHIISKLNAATCGATGTIHGGNRITPTIRIVHIFAPTIVKTDPANFRAIVQKLTGRHSARLSKKTTPKKMNPPISADKRGSIDLKKTIDQTRSAADHSDAPTAVDEHFFPKQPVQKEFVWYQDQVVAPPAEIKKECLEEDGVKVCDIFSGCFDGFEELDIFGTLLDSGSLLPDFPIFNRPTAEQNDYHSGIFRPSESGGFSHFYQL